MVCRFCMEWFIILNISNSIDDKIEYCATQTYRLANEMRYVNQISQMAFNYPTNTFNTVTLRASSQINSPNFTNSHNIDRNWSDVSISDSSIILICLRSIFPVALHSVAAVRGEMWTRARLVTNGRWNQTMWTTLFYWGNNFIQAPNWNLYILTRWAAGPRAGHHSPRAVWCPQPHILRGEEHWHWHWHCHWHCHWH